MDRGNKITGQTPPSYTQIGADERTALVNSSGWYTTEQRRRVRYEEYGRPVLAELLGTMLFVCVGVLSVLQSGAGGGIDRFSAIAIATGHGLTIALLVTMTGDISGGHLNPAVTAGVFLAGGISLGKAVCYIIAQLVGGLAGAGLARGILPSEMFEAIEGGAFTLSSPVTAGEAVLCEAVLTTVLVLTVILTAVDPQTKSPLAPIAIGFAVTVDILAGMFVSGAAMNPAISLGPAVAITYHKPNIWAYHYVYWVGPFLGSLVAGVFYRLLLASPEKRLLFKD